MKKILFVVFLSLLVSFVGVEWAAADPTEQELAIVSVLDTLHLAASKADGKTYFPLYADNAVFFGTDKKERWPIAEFQPYAQARFDTGTGWTYKVIERNIYFNEDKKTAWFDERLDHKAGEARGTGVLVFNGEAWKIVQYNLNFPVPNELFDPIYQTIKIYEEKK